MKGGRTRYLTLNLDVGAQEHFGDVFITTEKETERHPRITDVPAQLNTAKADASLAKKIVITNKTHELVYGVMPIF